MPNGETLEEYIRPETPEEPSWFESFRGFVDPLDIGEKSLADLMEMYEGMKSLGPLGKMIWELSGPGVSPEKEEARAEMIKSLYRDVPIEMVKDIAKVVDPREWLEHPMHSLMRAMIAKGAVTGLARVGRRLAPVAGRVVQRGAGGMVRGLERAKIIQPIGGAPRALRWADLGGYSPDEVVKAFRDWTSKDILRRVGTRKRFPEAQIKVSKIPVERDFAEFVTKNVEAQRRALKNMTNAYQMAKDKPALLRHWRSAGVEESLLNKIIRSEKGAVIGGREFLAPWEVTRERYLAEFKSFPPEMYEQFYDAAYRRGLEIPKKVMDQFPGRFTPRPPRPGPTPKGADPLWARGEERIGKLRGGMKTLEKQHEVELPMGYLDMEEAIADGWVRYVGPGTFEVRQLDAPTIRTLTTLIKERPPKLGVTVDFAEGGGFQLPMWEIEHRGFANAVRKSFPIHMGKKEMPAVIRSEEGAVKIPGTKREMMYGQEVDIEVIPEKVGKVKGPRKTRTTKEIIDLITEGEEPAPRTMLRKKPGILKSEKGAVGVGGRGVGPDRGYKKLLAQPWIYDPKTKIFYSYNPNTGFVEANGKALVKLPDEWVKHFTEGSATHTELISILRAEGKQDIISDILTVRGRTWKDPLSGEYKVDAWPSYSGQGKHISDYDFDVGMDMAYKHSLHEGPITDALTKKSILGSEKGAVEVGGRSPLNFWGLRLANKDVKLHPKNVVNERDIGKIVDLTKELARRYPPHEMRGVPTFKLRQQWRQQIVDTALDMGIDLPGIKLRRGAGLNRAFLDTWDMAYKRKFGEGGLTAVGKELKRRDIKTRLGSEKGAIEVGGKTRQQLRERIAGIDDLIERMEKQYLRPGKHPSEAARSRYAKLQSERTEIATRLVKTSEDPPIAAAVRNLKTKEFIRARPDETHIEAAMRKHPGEILGSEEWQCGYITRSGRFMTLAEAEAEFGASDSLFLRIGVRPTDLLKSEKGVIEVDVKPRPALKIGEAILKAEEKQGHQDLYKRLGEILGVDAEGLWGSPKIIHGVMDPEKGFMESTDYFKMITRKRPELLKGLKIPK